MSPTANASSCSPTIESVFPDRLRQSLWLALEHTVNRYLMSCAHGRWNGAEKATRHIELCNHYVATFEGCSLDRARSAHEVAWVAVHTATQALTDHLDEVIGFPLNSAPDYDALAPKFFAEFHRLAVGVLASQVEQSMQPPANIAVETAPIIAWAHKPRQATSWAVQPRWDGSEELAAKEMESRGLDVIRLTAPRQA